MLTDLLKIRGDLNSTLSQLDRQRDALRRLTPLSEPEELLKGEMVRRLDYAATGVLLLIDDLQAVEGWQEDPAGLDRYIYGSMLEVEEW